nr:arsenic resistance N-acetyltransferase ArsN2 [Candidatus Njordarchaeota archaeon]
MINRIRLRKATRRDLQLIEKLLKENNLPFEDIPAKIDSLFIATLNSRSIGIGGVEVYGERGLLRSLLIDKPFRGKGYGKALCGKLIQLAKSKGVEELYLLTTTADGFFKKIGFEKIKRDCSPAAIQNTTEFKELCPVSSTCMRKKISDLLSQSLL